MEEIISNLKKKNQELEKDLGDYHQTLMLILNKKRQNDKNNQTNESDLLQIEEMNKLSQQLQKEFETNKSLREKNSLLELKVEKLTHILHLVYNSEDIIVN